MTELTSRDVLGAVDPRLPFTKAIAGAGRIIAGVRPSQLGEPTPCADFDVRALLGHMVGVLHRVAAVARSEDPRNLAFVVGGVGDKGWTEAWVTAARDVQDAWSDASILARELQLPWTTMTGEQVMGIYTSEIVVHTWDLARATGQQARWDAVVVQASYDALHEHLGAEPRGGEIPFGPVVAVPADAPLVDRLLGWAGRQP